MKSRSFGILPFLAFLGWGFLFGFLTRFLLSGNIIRANGGNVYQGYLLMLDSFVFAILFGISLGIGIGMFFVPKVQSKKLSGLIIGFQLSFVGIGGNTFNETLLWWAVGIALGIGVSLLLILYEMKSGSTRAYALHFKIAKFIVIVWIAFLLWPLTTGIWSEVINRNYIFSNLLYVYITSVLVLLMFFMMSWKLMSSRISEDSVPIVFIGTRKSGKTFLSLIHLTYLNKHRKGEYVNETPLIIGGAKKMTSLPDILRMIAEDMRVIGNALMEVFYSVRFRDQNVQRIFRELLVRTLMGAQIATEVGSFSLYTLRIYRDKKSRILFGVPDTRVEFTDYAGELVNDVERYLAKYSSNPVALEKEVNELVRDLMDNWKEGETEFVHENVLKNVREDMKESVVRNHINRLANDLKNLNFDFRDYTGIFDFDSDIMMDYLPLFISVFVLSRIKKAKKIGVLIDGEALLATMFQAAITGQGELAEVVRRINEIEQLLERHKESIEEAIDSIISSVNLPSNYMDSLLQLKDPKYFQKLLKDKGNVIQTAAVYLKLLQGNLIKEKDVAVIVTKSDIFTLLWGDRVLTNKKNRERLLEKYVREFLKTAMPTSNYKILFSGAKLDPVNVISAVYGIDEIVEWEVEDKTSKLIAEVVLP